MKLIEINPINDAHAMQCIEAFNYYIIRQAGICHCDSRNCAAELAQWTSLGNGNGDGYNDEYKAEQQVKAIAAFDGLF